MGGRPSRATGPCWSYSLAMSPGRGAAPGDTETRLRTHVMPWTFDADVSRISPKEDEID